MITMKMSTRWNNMSQVRKPENRLQSLHKCKQTKEEKIDWKDKSWVVTETETRIEQGKKQNLLDRWANDEPWVDEVFWEDYSRVQEHDEWMMSAV